MSVAVPQGQLQHHAHGLPAKPESGTLGVTLDVSQARRTDQAFHLFPQTSCKFFFQSHCPALVPKLLGQAPQSTVDLLSSLICLCAVMTRGLL